MRGNKTSDWEMGSVKFHQIDYEDDDDEEDCPSVLFQGHVSTVIECAGSRIG